MAYGIAGTSLISDANLRHLYKGEDLTDTIGAKTLTNNNSVAFNPARFDNGFDLGASNTNKYLNTTGFSLGEFSFINTMSISLWFKLKTEIASGIYFLNYMGENTTYHVGIELYYDYNAGSPRLRANRRKENVSNNFADVATGFIGTGAFHHAVLTFDNTTLKLYFDNGTPGSIATTGLGAAGSETTGYIIGRSRDAEANNFAAAIIDDVALFDRALTSSEVTTLFNSPSPAAAVTTGAAFLQNFV